MTPRPVAYRCLDCSTEFKAGPGPVHGGALHELPGHAFTDGACPACGGLYVGRLSWYVVATVPQADAAVADRLEAAGHATLFLHHLEAPRYRNRLSRKQRLEGSNGAGTTLRRPVMPGYVFAGLVPPVDFYGLNNLPGVARVLTNEAGPAELDPREIDRLRAGADSNGRVEIPKASCARLPYRPGAVVKIKAGPFQGFTGPVETDDGKTFLGVSLEIFGDRRVVEVPWQAVEPAP